MSIGGLNDSNHMKRQLLTGHLTSLSVAILIALVFILHPTTVKAAETLNVQVRKAIMRKTPHFLSRVVTSLKYGDAVLVLAAKGTWTHVKATRSGKEGWMLSTSLTPEKITLSSGRKEAHKAADREEIALAGKGFNKKVEQAYRQKNQSISFTWVDRMEKYQINERQIRAFLQKGQVTPKGGDR